MKKYFLIMKKSFLIILFVAMVPALTACLGDQDTPKLLQKEGLAPYELTARESYLLQSFGIDNNAQIIAFNAPKEAISMEFNVYRLKDGAWESIGGGAVSIGKERVPSEKLTGNITMLLKDNYALDLHVNCDGRSSFKTNPIDLNSEFMASAKVFLTEFQKIEINKEIPVALMVYDSGSTMRSYSLQDYFEPSKFQGMDLVQAVTISFSDEEL